MGVAGSRRTTSGEKKCPCRQRPRSRPTRLTHCGTIVALTGREQNPASSGRSHAFPLSCQSACEISGLALYGAYDLKHPAALNGPQFLSGSILKNPFEVKDGWIAVPTGYGLGVEVDESKLREMRVREE